jgi:hypothetical protein
MLWCAFMRLWQIRVSRGWKKGCETLSYMNICCSETYCTGNCSGNIFCRHPTKFKRVSFKQHCGETCETGGHNCRLGLSLQIWKFTVRFETVQEKAYLEVKSSDLKFVLMLFSHLLSGLPSGQFIWNFPIPSQLSISYLARTTCFVYLNSICRSLLFIPIVEIFNGLNASSPQRPLFRASPGLVLTCYWGIFSEDKTAGASNSSLTTT